MTFTEEDHARAVALIGETPFSPERWPEALSLLAKAGGGWATQLLGIDPAEGVAFNFTQGLTPDMLEQWEELGGTDPVRNPRGRVALQAPSFTVLGENSFSTDAERTRSPIYQELFSRVDAPFVAAATLDDLRGVKVMAVVMRSHAQGHVDDADATRLAALLPHLRQAIRLRAKLEDRAAALSIGAMDALALKAIVCDVWGRIVGATASAERLLRSGTPLRIRAGRLEATASQSDHDLQAAIRRAVGTHLKMPEGPTMTSVVLRAEGSLPRIAAVAALPTNEFSLRLGGAVLVAISPAKRAPRSVRFLIQVYDLSPAEAEVAIALAEGKSVSEIAQARGASPETIRTQLKAIRQKLDVDSQARIVQIVGRLTGAPVEE